MVHPFIAVVTVVPSRFNSPRPLDYVFWYPVNLETATGEQLWFP